MCIIIAIEHFFFAFLEWAAPRDEIEYVEDEWAHDKLQRVSGVQPNATGQRLTAQVVQREKSTMTASNAS
jgi:hypothetical protein